MKVLVVEDEHRIASYIKKGLAQNKIVADVVYDGREGYEQASSENYDVLVLDVMLPSMDGVAICGALRRDGIHTPILMLTARDSIEDKVGGLEAGADDYLPKPFAFAELVARIRALSRRPEKRIKEALVVGDLKLDTNKSKVFRGNVEIQLSKKEYELLEFLMRHQGRVFPASELVEKVWSYDADVLDNAAQVYMGYLRTKIDRNFPNRKALVKTMRGFGYKIES